MCGVLHICPPCTWEDMHIYVCRTHMYASHIYVCRTYMYASHIYVCRTHICMPHIYVCRTYICMPHTYICLTYICMPQIYTYASHIYVCLTHIYASHIYMPHTYGTPHILHICPAHGRSDLHMGGMTYVTYDICEARHVSLHMVGVTCLSYTNALHVLHCCHLHSSRYAAWFRHYEKNPIKETSKYEKNPIKETYTSEERPASVIGFVWYGGLFWHMRRDSDTGIV